MAWVRIAGGLAGFLLVQDLSFTTFPDWIFCSVVLVFGTTAVMLFAGGRSDQRAIHLGGAFLLIASSFSAILLPKLTHIWDPWSQPVIEFVESVQPGAFIAFFLWLFFADFPRGPAPSQPERFARIIIKICLVVGAGLFVSNILLHFAGGPGGTSLVRKFLLPFSRSAPSLYWPLLFFLILPGLPYMLVKIRYVPRAEKRRVKLFVACLLLGLGPIVLETLLDFLFPVFHVWMAVPLHHQLGGLVIYSSLLSIPVTTSYSVLVNHVLDVRLIIRRALQYALARYTILALILAPWLFFALYLFRNRNVTVTALLSGQRVLWLLGISSIGALFFGSRHKALDKLDRRFFREHYDARQILLTLSKKCQSALTVDELTTHLVSSLDKALHPESVAVLVADPARAILVSSDVRFPPLSSSSRLVSLLTDSHEPLDIAFENRNSLVHRLPAEDQGWLADGGFRLLLPLIGTRGVLHGIIALGEKKSELPYAGEDRLLLSTIAISSSTMLENRELPTPDPYQTAEAKGRIDSDAHEEVALECVECHSLNPGGSESCGKCRGELLPTMVPYILKETFLLQKRIGQGGMSVVYQAHDLNLDRKVAIKTLPRMSPQLAIRLRREAKAMAAAQHPNLGTIYTALIWCGTPLLILEYLGGGTLADRLKKSPLTPLETVELGIPIAGVLEQTHASGTLHRDIKPSNIGFDLKGVPKLMDFGLARIIDDTRQESPVSGGDPFTQSTVSAVEPRSLTRSGHLVGTPPYLSPEAVKGQKPDVLFDLWSLALTLYESIAGTNPARKESLKATLQFIAAGDVPGLRKFRPDCPAPVADFFSGALNRNRRRRPPNAGVFRQQLEEVRSSLIHSYSGDSLDSTRE